MICSLGRTRKHVLKGDLGARFEGPFKNQFNDIFNFTIPHGSHQNLPYFLGIFGIVWLKTIPEQLYLPLENNL